MNCVRFHNDYSNNKCKKNIFIDICQQGLCRRLQSGFERYVFCSVHISFSSLVLRCEILYILCMFAFGFQTIFT